MNCSNCEYWTQPEDTDIPSKFDHICGHPAVGGDYNKVSKEHATDGANSYSTIATGPDFGCVHFKQKTYLGRGGKLYLDGEYIGYTDGPADISIEEDT